MSESWFGLSISVPFLFLTFNLCFGFIIRPINNHWLTMWSLIIYWTWFGVMCKPVCEVQCRKHYMFRSFLSSKPLCMCITLYECFLRHKCYIAAAAMIIWELSYDVLDEESPPVLSRSRCLARSIFRFLHSSNAVE